MDLVRVGSVKINAKLSAWLGGTNDGTRTLDTSLLLRPRPANLDLRPVLDFNDERSYPVPLTRQEHTFNREPALSKPRKMQRKRYPAFLLDDPLQPSKGTHCALVPCLM